MAEQFVHAYDSKTGKKLAHKVPENFFNIFPNLRKTPKQKARQDAPSATTDKKETK